MNIEQAYRILGLKAGARATDIKSAFRRMIKLHHPDKTKKTDSAAARNILVAYKTAMQNAGKKIIEEDDDDVFPHPDQEEALDAYNTFHQLLELLSKTANAGPIIEKIKEMISQIDNGYYEYWKGMRVISEACAFLDSQRQK